MKNTLHSVVISILRIFSPPISWKDIRLPGISVLPIPVDDELYHDHILKNPFTGRFCLSITTCNDTNVGFLIEGKAHD
ncbi:MAG: hypothetical protein K6T34_04115 [Thermoflavifilum sp.]|nr:hypothetical protein [Thermoflavifilum sp.]